MAVVDANTLISGSGVLGLGRLADRIVTTPEVLAEVRDKRSRSMLAALPFTVETQEPDEDAVKAGQIRREHVRQGEVPGPRCACLAMLYDCHA